MWFSSDDVEIFYEEYGDDPEGKMKPCMILLHGNGENHTYFKYQIAHFQKTYHVFALDTRGHGRSSFGKKHLDFDVLAEDLHQFVCGMKLHRVVLLGFSDGGNIALVYAIRHPEHVAQVILNGANLAPEGMEKRAYRSTVHGYWLLGLFAPYGKRIWRRREMIGLMAHHPHVSVEELHSLRMPVLVIAGEHDLIRQTHTEEIAEALPRRRLVIMKHADHFCARKCAVRFNRIVERFLEDTRTENRKEKAGKTHE